MLLQGGNRIAVGAAVVPEAIPIFVGTIWFSKLYILGIQKILMKKFIIIIFLMPLVLPTASHPSCIGNNGAVESMSNACVYGGDYRHEYYDSLIQSVSKIHINLFDTQDIIIDKEVFGSYTNKGGCFNLQPKYAVLGDKYQRMDFMIDSVSYIPKEGKFMLTGQSRVDGNRRFLKGNAIILDVLQNEISCETELLPITIVSEIDLIEYIGIDTLATYNGIYAVNATYDPSANKIGLDESMYMSDGYANRTFVGIRADQLNMNKFEKCICGDYRLPYTDDFNYGAGEKCYNTKYIKNGWLDLFPLKSGNHVEFVDFGLLIPDLYDKTPLYGTNDEESVFNKSYPCVDFIDAVNIDSSKLDDSIFSIDETVILQFDKNGKILNDYEKPIAQDTIMTIVFDWVKEVVPGFFVVSGNLIGTPNHIIGNMQFVDISNENDSDNYIMKNSCNMVAAFCLYEYECDELNYLNKIIARIEGIYQTDIQISDNFISLKGTGVNCNNKLFGIRYRY